MSAVQATRENRLPFYSTVGARRLPTQKRLYEIENVVEKPTPTEAEQTLLVPGLRAGHYLCLFGMHVLTHTVMDLLEAALTEADKAEPIQLSPSLARLAAQERFLALEVQGHRYNLGVKYGLLQTQLALALNGEDREEILAQLVEILASRGPA